MLSHSDPEAKSSLIQGLSVTLLFFLYLAQFLNGRKSHAWQRGDKNDGRFYCPQDKRATDII